MQGGDLRVSLLPSILDRLLDNAPDVSHEPPSVESADKYPKIAGSLLPKASKSEDPHVERLIPAFVFLAARVHHKIDDEFPEITDTLLGILSPHHLASVPSMSIVQFILDPDQGKLTGGHLIPRGTALYSQPVTGTPCRFWTYYPITVWPVEVMAARIEGPDRQRRSSEAVAAIRLELRCLGGTTFAQLELERLRFFLSGESQPAYGLYELLLNNTCQVQLRAPGESAGFKPIALSLGCLLAVGFGPDEGMLPYTPRSFLGYRLLPEISREFLARMAEGQKIAKVHVSVAVDGASHYEIA